MNRTLLLATIFGASACGGSATTVDSQTPATAVASQPQPEPEESGSDGQPMQIADAPRSQGTWDVYPPRPSEMQPPRQPIAVDPQGNEYRLLPENFRVYVRGNTVINHPLRGFEERVLPTVNDFRGAPGCYVACYSHDRAQGVYGVGGNMYVMGQVRVPGGYEGRVCRPARFGRADISAESGIKELCKASIPSCGGNCWGGGDTGGWFGVQ